MTLKSFLRDFFSKKSSNFAKAKKYCGLSAFHKGIAMTAERSNIRFLLGSEERCLSDYDPNMTVLQYLRQEEGLIGSKEGCGEGDCGACTVVLAEPDDQGDLHYRAVNSCLQFLPSLDGQQLITVEHLSDPEGALHPVQHALVEAHASQCGFCTPGFVMSLFALYQTSGGQSLNEIEDRLAGNLCRCTGYGPLVAAAQAIPPRPEAEKAQDRSIAETLMTLQSASPLAYHGSQGQFFAPTTLESLADLVQEHPEATLLAGGSDIGLWVTKQHRHLSPLISLGKVAALRDITETATTLRIGAMARYSDVQETLARRFPDFGEVVRRIGSQQIRNVGTLGGNIANGSPIGDTPPLLIALDALVYLRQGARQRALPLEDFFIRYGEQALEPGEFVEAIEIPIADTAKTQFKAYKVSKRFDQDITAVLGAFAIEINQSAGDWRVRACRACFGGMAGTPQRAFHLEKALLGQPWSLETIERAQQALLSDFTPLSDQRASASYRMAVAQNLLVKLFHEIEGTARTRLTAMRRSEDEGRTHG